MANMNIKAQCPPGWHGPVTAHYIWKCDWTYIYCYYLDPVTGEYSIQISDIWTEEEPPCSWLGNVGSWEQIKRPLRDSILSQIVKYLTTTNIWDEIEIPQCQQEFCFWYVNIPACYNVRFDGHSHKREPCLVKYQDLATEHSLEYAGIINMMNSMNR